MADTVSTLHLLATDSSDVVEVMAGQLGDRDAVVLLGDGCWLLCDDIYRISLPPAVRLGCLATEAAARGLPVSAVQADVEWLDEDALIEWIARHRHCLTWK